MSLTLSSSAGVCLCEPTELYNILIQCSKNPAVLNETYLTLFDARNASDFNEAHIMLARAAKKKLDSEIYRIPFGVHLPSCMNCIVYDSNTVSIVEDTPAVHMARALAGSGSKNPVMILKGGYERFSAEYPFLRTCKIIYTPMELKSLPHYPNEVMSLFLYLGDRHHAYNASLNYDLKIRAHVRIGSEMHCAFPEGITEFYIDVKDHPNEDLLSKFEELYEFLENQRKKSDRVLMFSELGISRAATMVISYLMKRHKWTLKKAFTEVKKYRQHICPLTSFLEQLSEWETQVIGEQVTDIHSL